MATTTRQRCHLAASMATPINPILSAAGGRRRLVDLTDPPLAPNGEPQLPQGQHGDSGGGLTSGQSSGMVMLFLFAIAVFIAWLCYPICNKAEEEQVTTSSSHVDGGGGGGGGEDRRRARRQRQASTAVPEIVVDIGESGRRQQQAAEPAALECTYRAAEGWEEGTCSVCLAELQDGEAVRMLMPCTHYFHATCVDRWMRKKATCPICRAPTVAAKAGRRRQT